MKYTNKTLPEWVKTLKPGDFVEDGHGYFKIIAIGDKHAMMRRRGCTPIAVAFTWIAEHCKQIV